MKFLDKLLSTPIINVKEVIKIFELSPKAANDLVKLFVEQKILEEWTPFNSSSDYSK
jgi:hypothetical protein